MIVLEELSGVRVYKFVVVDTETGQWTFPYESPIIAISQFMKGICRSSTWDDMDPPLNSYDITSLNFISIQAAKASLYHKYPELLL